MSKKIPPDSLFCKEYIQQAYRACLLWAATNEQLAEFFDVCETTIKNWRKNHPKFDEAIREGKAIADSRVAEGLYKAAVGCSTPDLKVFMTKDGDTKIVRSTKHYPPNPYAAITWLANRQPEAWRNKQEIGATDREGKDVPIGGVVLIPKDADPDEWMKNAVHDKGDKT